MRKYFGKVGFIATLFAVTSIAFLACSAFTPEAVAADKVTMRLHWKLSGMHIPFVVAKEKGFFLEEGIDVTVQEGTGSTATVKLIGAGSDTFGMGGTNVIVTAIARGMPIKQVCLLEASKLQGVLSKPEAGIKEPKDLIGKTIAGSGAGTSEIFNAFLAANNIPVEKVRYMAAGAARLEAAASGRADGTLGLGMDDVSRLKEMGIPSPQLLKFSDWGVPDHGDGVITHLDTIKKNPDMIKRFVKALLKGINYTFMDVEAAADIGVKHFPMAKKEILVTQLNNTQWLFPPPLGWQDPKVIEAVRNMTYKFAEIKEAKDMPLDRFFTNEFLPQY